MTREAVSPDFLIKQAKLNMGEMRLLRKDVTDMMRLLNANYELTKRVERRQGELRDDIELMVKMELVGSLANIQTKIEHSLAHVEDTIDTIATRVAALEGKK